MHEAYCRSRWRLISGVINVYHTSMMGKREHICKGMLFLRKKRLSFAFLVYVFCIFSKYNLMLLI